MTKPRYRIARHDDLPEVERLVHLAFGFSSGGGAWLEGAGVKRLRVVERDGDTLGGLMTIPMAQYFGGASVSTVGIAGVAIDPGERGRGTGTFLMRRCVQEIARDKIALSTLYPATVPLYRRAGYEIAGACYRTSVDTSAMAAKRVAQAFVHDADNTLTAGSRRAYETFARHRDGWLDRGDYIWKRTAKSREGDIVSFFLGRGGRDGYVRYVTRNHNNDDFDIQLIDRAVVSRDGFAQLVAFLGDFRSVSPRVHWRGGPSDPLLALLDVRNYDVKVEHVFMVRIAHLPTALEARGYAPYTKARLELDVRDDVVRGNHGRFVLEVEGGVGRVRPGGRGSFRIDVRDLAALYTGYLDARALAMLGRVEASASAIKAATSVFPKGAPSLPDRF